MDLIRRSLKFINEKGLYPDVRILESAPDRETTIGGRKMLLFCSSNYLGLASNEELKESVIAAVNKYGVGSSGSRLISGTFDVHAEAESTIAKFKNTEAALMYNTGYMANVGAITAITTIFSLNPLDKLLGTIVLSDELNHASIIDGCRLSKARVEVYGHKDMAALERLLSRFRRRRKLIVTDGVFSMDGDIAPLPQITALAAHYNAMVFVDDAHATGVLGKRGSGTPEHFGVESGVTFKMGTLSKAVAVAGGYVAADKELIEYLRIGGRPYIFSTSMPAMVAAGVTASIRLIERSEDLRTKLKANSEYLRAHLQRLGFNTLLSETQIIPILTGPDERGISFARALFEAGIFAPVARYPAVPKNQSRIRVTVMATHTKEDLDTLLSACESIGKQEGII